MGWGTRSHCLGRKGGQKPQGNGSAIAFFQWRQPSSMHKALPTMDPRTNGRKTAVPQPARPRHLQAAAMDHCAVQGYTIRIFFHHLLQRFLQQTITQLLFFKSLSTEQPVPSTPIPLVHPQRQQILGHCVSPKVEHLSQHQPYCAPEWSLL